MTNFALHSIDTAVLQRVSDSMKAAAWTFPWKMRFAMK